MSTPRCRALAPTVRASPTRPATTARSPCVTDAAGADAARAAGLATYVVDEPRRVLGPLAAWIYGEPARALTTIGVTGTNGKTTTAYLLEAGLRAAGRATGLIGTIETRIGDEARAERAHHPGVDRPAGVVRRDARTGCRGRRHGGVQPRAGARPGRRHDLRRRRVHQPVPGPPRLPPRPRVLFPGQGVAVHARAGARRRGRTWTTRTAPVSRASLPTPG